MNSKREREKRIGVREKRRKREKPLRRKRENRCKR